MDIEKWIKDLKSMDTDQANLQNLDALFFGFLESPEADDFKARMEVLVLYRHFKKLF